MPRAAVSASAFDAGWDWIDPQRDVEPVDAGEAWGGQGYYDWSQTGDFSEGPRARRTPPRTLRAVPDADARQRPARTSRPVVAPRPVAAAPRPVAAAPRPVAAARRRAPAVPEPVPALPLEPIAASPPEAPVAARRTVTITGRGAERHLSASRRRPAERSYERAGFQPDRIAMWAVLLGILMILAATTSAHAALLHP